MLNESCSLLLALFLKLLFFFVHLANIYSFFKIHLWNHLSVKSSSKTSFPRQGKMISPLSFLRIMIMILLNSSYLLLKLSTCKFLSTRLELFKFRDHILLFLDSNTMLLTECHNYLLTVISELCKLKVFLQVLWLLKLPSLNHVCCFRYFLNIPYKFLHSNFLLL